MEQVQMQPPQQLNLLKLTWPIFLELFLFTFMGMADTIMLSAVSDDAVAAVGVANQYIFLVILALEVIATGSAMVVAQYIGAKRRVEAGSISATAITLNLAIGLALSGLVLLFGDSLLRMMNLEGQLLVHAKTYFLIVGGWIFLQSIINTLSSLIRTYGFTRESMLVSLGINVMNVVGNYLLIFGHFGFPEMGVAGAAISTVFSRAVGAVVFFWLFYRLMEYRLPVREYFNISMGHVRKILKIGIPAGLESFIYDLCQAVFLYYVTFLGATALAARQYAFNVSMVIFVFSMAIGVGTSIIVGRLVGAGEYDTAYKRVWVSLKWGLGITIVVNGIVIALREPIIGMFTTDPEVLRLASLVLIISILLETGRTFNLILISSLRATGDAEITVYWALISMVGISLPVGYFLVFHLHFGLVGVWLAIALDEWVRGIVMCFRWRKRIWQNKVLVEPLQPAALVTE